MFYSDADSEGLCFHADAPVIQHLKCVSCTVSNRQHNRLCTDFLPAVNDKAAFPGKNVCHLTVKVEFTTQLDNTVPHSFHYVNKNIRPDMRLLLPENVLRSSERYKCLKDKAVSSGCIFYQGIQFSV